MMARVRRSGLAAVIALALAAALPMAAAAASWTLTVTPPSATVGVPTTYTLAATNTSDPGGIGCVVVDVAPSFLVASAAFVDTTAGGPWLVTRSGNRVTVRASIGADRLLLGERVRFNVTAAATQVGSHAWASTGYVSELCNSTAIPGDSPVIVVTGAPSTPAPTPAPTPPPTPAPTPPPTPAPTPPPRPLVTPGPTERPPTQGTPSPSPGTGPSRAPAPGTATPEPSTGPSGATNSATASESPSPSPRAVEQEVTNGGNGPPPSPFRPSSGIHVGVPSGQVEFQIPNIGEIELAGIPMALRGGSFAVPAAAIAGPGLLLLLWVGLQTIGAIGWLPAVRRLRGEDPEPDRPRSV